MEFYPELGLNIEFYLELELTIESTLIYVLPSPLPKKTRTRESDESVKAPTWEPRGSTEAPTREKEEGKAEGETSPCRSPAMPLPEPSPLARLVAGAGAGEDRDLYLFLVLHISGV